MGPEIRDKINQGLLEKAGLLMEVNQEFVVRRNITETPTSQKQPGKLQKGWRILNIDAQSGLATMHSSSNEAFHISLTELRDLNPGVFELDTELLRSLIVKKRT